ncbi:laminin subunit beta-1, partial [Plakobranchus ocellatus]
MTSTKQKSDNSKDLSMARSKPQFTRGQLKVGSHRRLTFSLVISLTVILFCTHVPVPAAADYGVCYDQRLDEYFSCVTSINDVVQTGVVTVTVEPESATCGDPPNTYRLLGDRTNNILTCDASSPTNRHPPSYMVDEDRSTTWWQSVNQSPGTTDLRFQFMRPANDGRSNYDMYYYAVSHVQVVARCFCNNHASECNYTDTDVYCDCQHFTTGKDCERCLPLYNERPWQRGSYLPYNTGQANICMKCECNDHADSCQYNATYGRGQCDDCQHNTQGYHCEMCAPLYYPNITLQLNDVNRCVACDCERLGVVESQFECTQTQTPTVQVGQCTCKPLVTGRRCDSCTSSYWGLITGPTPGTCTACGCNLDGTAGQSNTCDQDTGQCPCKTSVTGQLCDTCADSYYAFPTGNPERGCLPCDCDKGGAVSATCDKTSGVCSCRSGITGDKCDRTVN